MADIIGTAGNDTLIGGKSAHKIWGLGGDDVLVGGASHDVLYGGDGADQLFGGQGSDRMYGGAGADVFVLEDNTNGRDRIEGGEGDPDDYDTIDTSTLSTGINAVYGDDGVTKLTWDTGGPVDFSEIELLVATDFIDFIDATDAIEGITVDDFIDPDELP